MKSEKGITIISLTVYVIAMTIVIAVTARISSFLFKNTSNINEIEAITQYTTFSSYFTEEINTPNIKILECTDNYIAFDNGVQYTFIEENNAIYKNTVKICDSIENCTFEKGMNVATGKSTVKVTIKVLNDSTHDKEPIVYTLK